MKKIVATLLFGVTLFAAGPLRRAPGFCLIDTNGQWQDLADYRGKIVLVEFMADHLSALRELQHGAQRPEAEVRR